MGKMKKTNDFLSDAKISSLKIDFVCQFFLTMRPSKKDDFWCPDWLFSSTFINSNFWHFPPNSDHNLKNSTDHQKSFFLNFVTFIRPAKKAKKKDEQKTSQ